MSYLMDLGPFGSIDLLKGTIFDSGIVKTAQEMSPHELRSNQQMFDEYFAETIRAAETQTQGNYGVDCCDL
jgi:hypothetical protein